jgi:hypothetical protein
LSIQYPNLYNVSPSSGLISAENAGSKETVLKTWSKMVNNIKRDLKEMNGKMWLRIAAIGELL